MRTNWGESNAVNLPMDHRAASAKQISSRTSGARDDDAVALDRSDVVIVAEARDVA